MVTEMFVELTALFSQSHSFVVFGEIIKFFARLDRDYGMPASGYVFLLLSQMADWSIAWSQSGYDVRLEAA